MSSEFYYLLVAHIIICCVVKLYGCIATPMVLKQPSPGEGAREKEGTSNIKLKAFRIIFSITLTVILMYAPLVVFFFFKIT